jgi:hypothetical protein
MIIGYWSDCTVRLLVLACGISTNAPLYSLGGLYRVRCYALGVERYS